MDNEHLTQRLDRLEQEVRWWRKAVLLGVTSFAAILLMGQAIPKTRIVEVERLVLKDRNGKVRAFLGEGSYDPGTFLVPTREYGLHLYGPDGQFRAALVEAPGGAELRLEAKDRPSSARLSARGGAVLDLNATKQTHEQSKEWQEKCEAASKPDPDREWKCAFRPFDEITLFASASPQVPSSMTLYRGLSDKQPPGGNFRETIEVTLGNGNPALLAHDANGQKRAALHLGGDGVPSLELFDQAGKGVRSGKRAALYLRDDGTPSLELFDQVGRARAVLGRTELETSSTGAVDQRAESSLVLFNKEGKVIWKAP